jgi:chitin synthase
VINALPVSLPPSLHTALSAIKAFTCHVTPFNPSLARHSSLAVNFTLNLVGEIRGASLALSKSGIDTKAALLQLPEERGYRAFDVFYYLLNAASTPAEREFLGLRHPSVYAFLNRSGTYDPPSYLPATDDAAAAEDFRLALKEIGIKGAAHRNLLATLAGLLKLGDTLGFLIDADDLDDVCEEVAELLGFDPEFVIQKCSTSDRTIMAAGLYECLVDWVIGKANHTIEREVQSTRGETSSRLSGLEASDSGDDDGEDVVSITVVDIPNEALGKAVALRGIFDDSLGLNSEMKDDGVELEPPNASVVREMQDAVHDVAVDLGVATGPVSQDRSRQLDRRDSVLERIGHEVEEGGFLRDLIFPVSGEGVLLGKHGRFDLADTILSSRVWYHLSLHPTDDDPQELANVRPSAPWSAAAVSRQLRSWRLAEWANRRDRSIDYTADFDIDEFSSRYSRLGCSDGRDGVESWIMERGWSNGDAVVGRERVWIRESAWWEAESMIDMKSEPGQETDPFLGESPYEAHNDSGFFPPMPEENPFGSHENLLSQHQGMAGGLGAKSIAPTMARTVNTLAGDYGLGAKGDDRYNYDREYDGPLDPELGDPKHVTTEGITFGRRAWVAFVWGVTFWIPSFVLRYIGRMKRPDVRMAWREKVVLVLLIFLLNAAVVFYIIEFGNLLCPNFDKAWNQLEVSEHQGETDFYVSIHGKVYDITSFWQIPHSTVPGAITNDQTMIPFAGQNLDGLFPPPLYVACPQLVKDKSVKLQSNSSISNTAAIHWSGANTQFRQSDLKSDSWYTHTFVPKISHYYKGDLVWDAKNVSDDGSENRHMWIILNNNIYDFTDYMYTQQLLNPQGNIPHLAFMPKDVMDLIESSPGQDLTSQWGKSTNFTNALDCMNNVFYKGITDFRESPRCQVNNYILLAFTIILCVVILTKFVSALQFGAKRRPGPQDKFVICQVPAYTEGEDQLRKALDSLTALEYDNKRKLICVICDGMIVGSGNDRPTPKIVLDILGVDPKIDPPALPFKSVGQGSDQLNYGKVYSGLYEFEGNVVPYIVVVKVGKESEQAKNKPGNRGKRDSQIMLLSLLNRVHHRAPMNPLELEIFHQINNIIGVDPELYEYIFMVDADTAVREDSLNRLVANCAHDAKIAGICGETSLQNEGKSWWTMIQVYEYYISHHLAKAFESLFGSVTCLPGW